MLSFELSAIDLILVLSVGLLLILYISKISSNTEKIFNKIREETKEAESDLVIPKSQHQYSKCPRGFGNIKRLAEDNSISEKCLGCYMIMECYTENNLHSETNTIQ